MKKILISVAACLILASCGNSTKTTNKAGGMQNDDSLFDTFKAQFVEDLWKLYPSWASSQGYHKYDSLLVVPNGESRTKELAFCKESLGLLKGLNLSNLSDNNKTDYYIIENQLNSTEWSINTCKTYE